MLDYYLVLRSVLRTKPHLRDCLIRCSHCRIFFLTDPRNAGRMDLGCPFGCREANRKESSTKRSVAYYREDCGKLKRKIQNEKRPSRKTPALSSEFAPEAEVRSENYLAPQILTYLQMLLGLLEGRRVSIAEVNEMLARGLRQRSIAHYRKLDHMVGSLNEHPP